ncbi:hypothetical protein ACI6QG_08555 [Roseococcus sp. DSY-14]|uniref:hypothetical protein n=1 Tax=Roseococcus sp. DSY-14 TaxID=3369650 RepID=UPI00387AB04E
MNLAVPLLALAYNGLVLFWLAHALRKIYTARRAAWSAFLISVAVHSATMLFLDAENRLTALIFWAVPHMLLLPLLLYSAQRANRD